MARPILGEIELPLTQKIEIEDDHVLVQHGIPALEGDFLQRLGRRASRVKLNGVMTGTEAAESLKKLRAKFREGAPVSFVADIATATQVDQVLIEEFGVRELAGKAERFAYELTLREMIAPPAQQTEAPPPEPPPPRPPNIGELEVEVIVEGQPDFDFSKVEVTVEGIAESDDAQAANNATGATGGQFRRTLTNRTGNVWTDDQMPPGQFTASAVVNDPPPMSGSASVTVRRGELAHATITLHPGAVIAKAFIVHFHFDRSFIEPCMREVLQQVAAYAQAHPNEKLAIIGHADKAGHAIVAGPTDYNQSLSERRARAVYAYLTKDRDRGPAITDWSTLRLKQTGELPTLKDNWSKEGEAREYQYILMDLGFYSGNITEQHDAATDAAVRSFQRDKGLTDDGIVGDATWAALIDAYLSQDTVAVPESQFFPNARDACDNGKFKWMGASDRDPANPNAPQNGGAWRPNRRTEMLFIATESIPCEVPQPVTFNKPAPGAVGKGWCLGPGNFDRKPCFITRDPNEAGPEKFLVQPAEPGEVIVRGRITFEDGSPAAGVKYVLIAPDGEFMDGEIPSGTNHGRPIKGITDANGEFSYPDKPKGVGIYTMEVDGDFVARADDEPPSAAKGSVVCKRLDGSSDFVVIIGGVAGSLSLEFVDADNIETLITNVSMGGIMRVRADLSPGSTGDVITVEIFGADAAQIIPAPPPPVTTPALEFVAADNADNPVNNVQVGGTMRLRADVPDAAGNEITVEIFGADGH